jgi:hypothetical protein
LKDDEGDTCPIQKSRGKKIGAQFEPKLQHSAATG